MQGIGCVLAGNIGDVLTDLDDGFFIVGGQDLRGGDNIDLIIIFIGIDYGAKIREVDITNFDAFLENSEGKTGGQTPRVCRYLVKIVIGCRSGVCR